MDMSTVRRPRIDPDLVERINKLRSSEETFEGFINYVLGEYVERMEMRSAREDSDEPQEGERLYDFEDAGGAFCYVNRLNGGWGKDNHKDVIAGLVIDATEQGFDALGVYLTANDLRPLRDVCTELLDEIPRPAHGAQAENKP